MKNLFHISKTEEKKYRQRENLNAWNEMISEKEQDEQILDDILQNAEEVEELQSIPKRNRTEEEKQLLKDDKEFLENVLQTKYNKTALERYIKEKYPQQWTRVLKKEVRNTRKFFKTLFFDAIKEVPLTTKELEKEVQNAAKDFDTEFIQSIREEDGIPENRLVSLMNAGVLEGVKNGNVLTQSEAFIYLVKETKSINESVIIEAIRSCLVVNNIELAEKLYKKISLKSSLKKTVEKEIEDYKEYRLGKPSEERKRQYEAKKRNANNNDKYKREEGKEKEKKAA